MVKRVIALPGDTLYMKDYKVYIRVPGSNFFVLETKLVTKDYALLFPDLSLSLKGYPLEGTYPPITLSEGEYFLLSDRRGRGSDSFLWGPCQGIKYWERFFLDTGPFMDFPPPYDSPLFSISLSTILQSGPLYPYSLLCQKM